MDSGRLRELVIYCPITGVFTWKEDHKVVKAGQSTGYKTTAGYLLVFLDKRNYLAHRLAFLYMEDRWPKEIDHINRIRHDNRWINLREADRSLNMRNKTMTKRNTSGVAGIYLTKEGKWQTSIGGLGKIYNGKDFFEACCRRKSAEFRLGYHENHGN